MTDLIRGAVLGGLFSILTVLLTYLLYRRDNRAKEQSNLADVIVKSAQALDITSEQLIEAFREVKQLRAELEAEKELRREEHARMQKELRRWGLYASLLVKQVISAGLDPVPFPPDSDPKIKGVS